MDCKQVEKNLVSYIDNELSNKESIDFELHLNQCNQCKLLISNVSETYSSLEINKNLPDDFFFYNRLQQKLENKYTYVPSIAKRILQPLAFSILLITAGYMGVFIGNQYKSIAITNPEDIRNTQLKTYAEENYLSELNNENYELLLTSNQ